MPKQNITDSVNTNSSVYNNGSIITDEEPPSAYHEKHPKKFKKSEKKVEYPKNSSYISISNISLRDVVVEEEEVEEKSLRSQFDMDQMHQTFEQYLLLARPQGVNLLPETLENMTEMFENLTDNDNEIAEEMYDTILVVDGTYPLRFIEFAHLNNPTAGFLTNVKSKIRDHLTRQFKKVLEFHRININALINDKQQADHLMHIFGLSHYLMKIPVDDFDILALTLIKVLLHLNICDEENVIHIVGYLCTFTKSVRRTIADYNRSQEKIAVANKLKNRLEELGVSSSCDLADQNSLDKNLAAILSSGGTVNLWARKNYREMKDWQLLRDEIRRIVYSRHPITTEMDLYLDRPNMEMSAEHGVSRWRHKGSGSNSSTRMQDKCFLTWLKKGYKFKREETYVNHKYSY